MKTCDDCRRVLVLVSGGMDSVTALYAAVETGLDVVAGVSFNYGAKHHRRELPLARHHCRRLGVPHQVLHIEAIAGHFRSDLLKSGGAIPPGPYRGENMRQTVVPFRNGVMLALAAGLAESMDAHGVWIAAHGGDHAVYPDCREVFMQAMGQAMRLGTDTGVRLCCPFLHLDKASIVRRGTELGVDFSRTWSCYAGGDRHCGRCGTCLERRAAFHLAGVADPTRYQASRKAE